MNIYRSINHNESTIVYQTFYGIFQLFIEHKMVIDMDLCCEFLTIVKTNENEEFLNIHYETVFKLMKSIPINKEILDIYYRFIEQTSSILLYQETRKIFQSDLIEKLANEFYNQLWKHLLNKKDSKQEQIIDWFVDFIMIERKKKNMILLSNDNDEIVMEKINLLKTKKKILTKDKITEQGLQFIQMFIQNTFSKIDDIQTLTSGQLWRALILHNSLSDKDTNEGTLTVGHVVKISQLMENCLSSSSIIALTIIEFISHDITFTTSFWYTILKRNSHSELYLLAIRISFLLMSPTNDYSDKFIELLKTNLSSFNSNIRLLTLRVLSSFIEDKNEKNNVILTCLLCEECPLNVYEFRAKIIHLQKLSVEFILLNKNTSSFHLAMYYLLGILCSNFTPLWSICTELLGSYGNKAIEYIGHTYFWSILNEKFQLVNQHTDIEIVESIDDELINEYLENEVKREYEVNDQSIDYIQYRINLFQILTYFPNECENKTKILLPIIFDFFTNEYFDHLLSLGLFGLSKSSYEIHPTSSKRLSRKFSIKTLETILNLLKQFHHYQQWYEPLRLYQFYVRLLLSSDNSIQQSAYHCLLKCHQIPQSIIQSNFLKHSEELVPLFNPSTCRKTFHELIQGALLEQNLSDDLKNQYAFILIRVVYSKLNAKRSLGSTTRGRKDYFELNRKYLFQFLITFASNHLYKEHFHYFIQLLLEPFHDELFSSNENQWLNIFENKINLKNEEFHLISYEIFIKYIQHSLLLLKTFVSKLGVYIHEKIDYIMKFYILTIKFVDYLTNQKCSSQEETDDFQVKKIRILLKRIRSMSYKGLQILFKLFDNDDKEIFQKDLIDSLWLCCIKQSYLDNLLNKTKQREDIVHMLKLAVIWSNTTYLREAIINDRQDAKDLVKCSMESGVSYYLLLSLPLTKRSVTSFTIDC
ncbi:unnamed protein product [Adineta steineri]|uniref:U3 small nucleolar RNA-associated protein 20 N-terminal domain-containing protein n=1 Tax=Adineta steineri TaxID=433720 RepID=A0A819XC00_9BILA|nr:unnamed protein product [Adineta steineri]